MSVFSSFLNRQEQDHMFPAISGTSKKALPTLVCLFCHSHRIYKNRWNALLWLYALLGPFFLNTWIAEAMLLATSRVPRTQKSCACLLCLSRQTHTKKRYRGPRYGDALLVSCFKIDQLRAYVAVEPGSWKSRAKGWCLFCLSHQTSKWTKTIIMALRSDCLPSYKNYILQKRDSSKTWYFINAPQSLKMPFPPFSPSVQNCISHLAMIVRCFLQNRALPIHVRSGRVKKCYECPFCSWNHIRVAAIVAVFLGLRWGDDGVYNLPARLSFWLLRHIFPSRKVRKHTKTVPWLLCLFFPPKWPTLLYMCVAFCSSQNINKKMACSFLFPAPNHRYDAAMCWLRYRMFSITKRKAYQIMSA